MKTKEFDCYDSQIIYLAKGHFYEYQKDNHKNNIDMLKAIWAWRCGIDMCYVSIYTIIGHIIEMLEKCGELNSRHVQEILSYMVSNPKNNWKIGIDENASMEEVITSSLLTILSGLRVNDAIHVDGELVSIPLILLKEKDLIFTNIFEEEDDE
jgi:hypothetical protein